MNNDLEYLQELVRVFRDATRTGSALDVPEGSRIITISDTAAKQIADRLENIVKKATRKTTIENLLV